MVLYLIMSSLYTSMPIFLGLFFAYNVINYENVENKIFVYLSFGYLFLFDLTKGFYLFSSILFFIIFYTFFVDKIKNFFSCSNCILAIYIVSAYIGHYILNLFISYILNQDTPLFTEDYLYYVIIDLILGLILFKGKI